MEILKIDDNDKTEYMDLLLIADEKIEMIEKYLYRGDMFGLFDDGLKAVCVVTKEKDEIFEMKNIVTVEEYQKKGYGRQLILFILEYYKPFGKELLVGTGDCPSTLTF